jgi:excisionase family DNA binding protein
MKSADLTLPSSVVTVAEAAQILGISKPAVYAGLRNGRLRSWHEQGRRVMDRDGLEQRWWGSSQRPGGDHVGPRTRKAATGWELVAERLNKFLGPSWPAPPYSADQTATLALCLGLAQGDG